MATRKNTTNYSKDEMTRQMKRKLERKVALARNVKKGKESFTEFPKPAKAKKSNVKTSNKTTKSNRSSAQLRAIFAKKK